MGSVRESRHLGFRPRSATGREPNVRLVQNSRGWREIKILKMKAAQISKDQSSRQNAGHSKNLARRSHWCSLAWSRKSLACARGSSATAHLAFLALLTSLCIRTDSKGAWEVDA